MSSEFKRHCGFKVISLFISSKDYDRIERVHSAGSRLYGLLKKTAPKCTPAVAFVEAALSLADLLSSFCEYQQAVEKTKQFKSQNEAFRCEIKNFKNILEIEEFAHLHARNLQSKKQLLILKQEIDNLKKIGVLLRNVSTVLNELRVLDIGSRGTRRRLEEQFFETNIRYLQTLEMVV